MKNKRVVIIGCGRIVGHHLNSIINTKGIEALAVCDLILEKAVEYAKEFNVKCFTDYRKMLTEIKNIDLVVIATPSGMHYEHAIEIIGKFKKNVVIEKPTFLRHDQLDEAYLLAETNGVNIFPVFQNRYNKAVKRVKSAIDNNELGDLRIFNVRVRWCRPQRYYDMSPWRGTYSHDGGALTNQGIHHLDLLRHLGGEIKEVNSMKATLGSKIEVEDSIVSTFSFDNGSIGSLEITTSARPIDYEASISIIGSKGLAQLGGIAVNKLDVFSPDPGQCKLFSDDFMDLQDRGKVYGRGHSEFYQDVCKVLFGENIFPIIKEDCMNTISLLHSFYLSAEEKKWINVKERKFSSFLGIENNQISDLYRI